VTGVVQVPAHVVRQRITVTGAVQGVGFRPFAFRLAHELGLAGFVGNDAGGAFAEVEGPETAVAQFTDRLAREAPPLARDRRPPPPHHPGDRQRTAGRDPW
jgi:hydrogenase maturation protein HypF